MTFLRCPRLPLADALAVPYGIPGRPLFGIDEISIPGGGNNGYLHAGLYPAFQVDIIIQRQVRPEIIQLDPGVFAADPVIAAKPLDYADRVSVDIMVDKVVP